MNEKLITFFGLLIHFFEIELFLTGTFYNCGVGVHAFIGLRLKEFPFSCFSTFLIDVT